MFVTLFRKMFNSLHVISAAIFLFATALTAINAITRYCFHYVIFGSEELCTYSVLIMSFLMFPIMEAEDKHLSVDIFSTNVKNQTFKEIVFVIRGFITMGLFAILIYYGYKVTATAAKYASASPTLQMPKDIVFGITTASFVFAILGWICIIFFNKRRAL